MKKLILLISLATCSLSASESSKIAAATELLDAMMIEQTMIETVQVMLDMEMANNPQLAPFKDIMLQFMNKHMAGPKMKQDFAKMYAEVFTESELKDLIEFYKTPTGKKASKLLPELTQKGAMWGQQQVMEHQEELSQLISEKMENM